jgi:hypothetical protein
MHVIFSCENTDYMWWQAELLQYTYARVGMKAQLTALVSATGEPPRRFTCSSVDVSNYEGCLGTGVFKPLNKPGSLAEWAIRDASKEETVFIIDPDSAFVGLVPDPGPLKSGEAFAQAHHYMDLYRPASQTVLSRHCSEEARARVQPVGIYIIIKKADLVEIAPRWLQKTIDIKNDQICRNALRDEGWISDMWGYAIVAAELGIRHRITTFSQMTGSNCLEYPIIHYCLPVVEGPGNWWDPAQKQTVLWSKWTYKPWDVPQPHSAPTVEGRALLESVAALALARNQKPHSSPGLNELKRSLHR